VDYERLTDAGSMMGSGGMIVMDEDTCMVDVARYFLEFTSDESCGKCTPCREGTKRMLQILTRITKGRGRPGDAEYLRNLAEVIKETSLCGLGGTAPNPVLSTLRYFHDEYQAHIFNRRCPGRVCKELITYSIDQVKCPGCLACLKQCPTEAIVGEAKVPHRIIGDKCIKCGACLDVCNYDAVIVE
jgi:Na+-translocating ferredoxin:NAD+ oxidoreductase RNF subunit RnfB